MTHDDYLMIGKVLDLQAFGNSILELMVGQCTEEIKITNSFTDWSGTEFLICEHCTSYFQVDKITTNYTKTDWTSVKDPDGRIRDMTTERDFKLKNWYGDSTRLNIIL